MTSQPTYTAREILNRSLEAVWSLPEEAHVLVMDDQTQIATHTRETISMRYLWGVLVEFPNTPITADMHLQGKQLQAGRVLEIINATVWAVKDHYPEVDTELLAKRAIEANNELYNAITTHLSQYVTTMSMFDVVEVMDHPKIQEANANVKPTQHSIEEECYKQIAEVLKDPTQLRGNPIAEGIRAGTLSMGQILQSVGPRGPMTDINSSIFPNMVLDGHISGISRLHDSMVESRSGSKSLLFNKILLKNTEFFNRKMQLVSQYVKNIHMGDCGTPHHIVYPVTETTLPALCGKYQITPSGLVKITGKETELIGQDIPIRSVLGCTHPDPAGVCQVCYGRLAYSIPRGTNIGQVSAAVQGDKITSAVLGTKHLDSTSKVEAFQLGPLEAKFLEVNKANDAMYLRQSWRNKTIRVTLLGTEVPNLSTARRVDIEALEPAKLSSLSRILLTVGDDDDPEYEETLNVSLFNRMSSLSRAVLYHIRENVWLQNTSGNIELDLTGFDFTQPLLTLPLTHVNMYEKMKYIKAFLHSNVESVKPLTRGRSRRKMKKEKKYIKPKFLRDYTDATQGVAALAEILNTNFYANLVHCEVLVYALMIRSRARKDYRLPIPALAGEFESYSKIMGERSLGASMAFQGHIAVLTNPTTFTNPLRNDHPYDLMPTGGVLPT